MMMMMRDDEMVVTMLTMRITTTMILIMACFVSFLHDISTNCHDVLATALNAYSMVYTRCASFSCFVDYLFLFFVVHFIDPLDGHQFLFAVCALDK